MEIYKEELLNIIDDLSVKRNKEEVFDDILKLLAYSLANYGEFSERRENEFMKISAKYADEEQSKLTMFLALLKVICTKEPDTDVLGDIFEKFNMQNKSRGQVFTPPHIARLMSDLILTKEEVLKTIEDDGFITLSDMACGSGRLITEAYNKLIGWDIEPKKILILADDLDLRCCCMTFIQLNLKGANAIVRHRDSLNGKTFDTLYTSSYRDNEYLKNLLEVKNKLQQKQRKTSERDER